MVQCFDSFRMRCTFHKHAVHGGQIPDGRILYEPSSQFHHGEIAIDAFIDTLVFPCAKPIFKGWCEERGKALFGGEHSAGRNLKIRWPRESRMAMQPPDSLQQNIDGAVIGKEVIGVNVQTLFERLRSDDKNSAILPELGRKSLLYCSVEQPAVFWLKASMVQSRAVLHG